jgi:hypothetical protein
MHPSAKRVSVVDVDKNCDVLLRYKAPHQVLPIDATIPFPDAHLRYRNEV